MRISKADVGPRMNLKITPKEIEAAKKAKAEFKVIIKELSKAVKVVVALRDAIVEERPSKDDLKNTYRGRLVRYRKKIRDAFNVFLSHTKSALEILVAISDPEMERLREILTAEIGELSDGVEALLDLLDEVEREGFTKALEGLVAQMEKRNQSIAEVIDSQLFNHIDQDILGKVKISELRFNIRRRARILRQLLER